jgi:hypothetical protein
MSVANAIKEEVVQEEEVVDDCKVACDICEKRYKANGLNTHKAVYKKVHFLGLTPGGLHVQLS